LKNFFNGLFRSVEGDLTLTKAAIVDLGAIVKVSLLMVALALLRTAFFNRIGLGHKPPVESAIQFTQQSQL
jgi:hypothetical protein